MLFQHDGRRHDFAVCDKSVKPGAGGESAPDLAQHEIRAFRLFAGSGQIKPESCHFKKYYPGASDALSQRLPGRSPLSATCQEALFF